MGWPRWKRWSDKPWPKWPRWMRRPAGDTVQHDPRNGSIDDGDEPPTRGSGSDEDNGNEDVS